MTTGAATGAARARCRARWMTAGELATPEWEALARCGFHRRRWFTLGQQLGWQPRHLIVEREGVPCAIVPAHHIAVAAPHDLHDRWLGPAAGLADRLALRLRPTLAVGAPFAPLSAPLGDLDALSDAAHDDVLAQLEARARADGARAVVLSYLGPEHATLLRAGERRGYVRAFAGSTASLDVAWDSFDDYLASRSKSVRRTVRAELRDFAALGLRAETRTELTDVAERMDALLRESWIRRNGRTPAWPVDLVRRLVALQGGGYWAQLTWQGERLVGMSINAEAAGTIDGSLCAFAPEHRGGPAYYNDLVYEPLRYACRTSARRLELGPSALLPKVLRGATLRPRWTLVRGTSRAGHAGLALLGRAVDLRNRRKEARALSRKGTS